MYPERTEYSFYFATILWVDRSLVAGGRGRYSLESLWVASGGEVLSILFLMPNNKIERRSLQIHFKANNAI